MVDIPKNVKSTGGEEGGGTKSVNEENKSDILEFVI